MNVCTGCEAVDRSYIIRSFGVKKTTRMVTDQKIRKPCSPLLSSASLSSSSKITSLQQKVKGGVAHLPLPQR